MMTTLKPTLLKKINSDWIREFSKERNEPNWVCDLRLKAFRAYENLHWPNIKDERWKRTNLSALKWDTLEFRPTPNENTGPGAAKTTQQCSLEDALLSHETEIQDAWTEAIRLSNQNKFRCLTLALGNGGTCVFVPKNKFVPTPLSQPVSGSEEGTAIFPLNFIVVEEGAEIQLWNERYSATKIGAFISSYTFTHIKKNARVSSFFLQSWDEKTINFRFQDVIQERDSSSQTISVSLGGKISRQESSIQLKGENAQNKILGVLFGSKDQRFENWVTQNHLAPKTTSDIQFRGVLQGKSQSFFSGLVSIVKEAQKSNAFQSSKSLLLSDDAHADAIPNLEILADDVKCSHGAAVGPVDEDQKFYLQTRGIPPKDAEKILVEGFFDPVLSAVPSEAVQEKLKSFIEKKLRS